MTRVPEQVECAGSESSRRSWGAPGRHVEPGPPDGVRMMERLRSDELVVANSAELDACASDAGARRLIRSVLQRRSRRCRWPRHPPPPRAPAGGYVVPAVCCQLLRGAERSHSQFYAKRDSPSAVDPAAVSRSFGQPARRTQLASDGCCPAAMVVDRLVPGPPPQKVADRKTPRAGGHLDLVVSGGGRV